MSPVIVCSTATQCERLISVLKPYGITPEFDEDADLNRLKKSKASDKIIVTTGRLSEGFVFKDENLAVITENEIFGLKFQRRKKVRKLASERIYALNELSVDDIVVHTGFRGNLERKESLERVKDALSTIMGKTLNTRVRINLESMAGSGTVIGSTLEELSDILYGLSDNDRTGICLDTAHLYASGYDLGSSEAYDRFRSRLLSLFEPDYVACWHLNDSSRELGSNIDRHENIGEGYLGLQVFGSIINDPLWEDVPCILETPKSSNGDRKNLSILRKLRGG